MAVCKIRGVLSARGDNMMVTMTSEERAQLIEDIERSANLRRGIAEQARLGHDFDIAAAWEEVDELDASVNARIRKARTSPVNAERHS
jgi:hypothetical protein